ncbi:MAG: hypothetical protein E7313_01940 [Clostridiales bacterium]|nr:hypothetical protein [Clostridiales bacterium]
MNKNMSKKTHIKKKIFLNRKKIGIIVVAFSILLYCMYLLIKLIASPTDTFIVVQDKIYKEETVEGYIIRDEQIVEEEIHTGKMVQLKSEGKKVSKGDSIYRYAIENEQELKDKISELDVQIQETMKNSDTLFSTDIKLLENHIQSELENVYENTNIEKIKDYKKEINGLILKKSKVIGGLSSSGTYLKKLIAQRSEYENQLNSSSKYIYANKSGIISYKIDDYEEVLKVGDFSYLNKSFLDSLNIKVSQVVATSENKAKIIDNFSCYITCISKTDEAKQAEIGNKVKLRLTNIDEIPAKLVYKNNENDNEVLLVFEVKQSVENLIDYRKVVLDIIWWSDTGIKIPNNAIQYEDNFAYVIRNRAGYHEKILVKVLRQNDKFAIVENYSMAELEELGYDISKITVKKILSIYDEILINKKK